MFNMCLNFYLILGRFHTFHVVHSFPPEFILKNINFLLKVVDVLTEAEQSMSLVEQNMSATRLTLLFAEISVLWHYSALGESHIWEGSFNYDITVILISD